MLSRTAESVCKSVCKLARASPTRCVLDLESGALDEIADGLYDPSEKFAASYDAAFGLVARGQSTVPPASLIVSLGSSTVRTWNRKRRCETGHEWDGAWREKPKKRLGGAAVARAEFLFVGRQRVDRV